VARALTRALAELGGGILLAEQLPAEAGWGALTGAHAIRSEPSPALTPGAAGWEGYLAGCSRRLRKELRRQQRRIAALNAVHYRQGGGGDPADLQHDLDILFSLHESVFGDDSRFLNHADFHREFAEIARRRGWLRMWFLEIEGRAVAAWYGFRYAGIELDYQGGRDPEWDGFSVGTAIIAHAMRSALEDGVDEYRLLRGAEHYKQRFATHDRGLQTLVIGNGAVSALAAAAAAALPDRIASVAKRRLAA
jgi:CelD/BcsL family acetyltransferase involved in cellulose biosynthesis